MQATPRPLQGQRQRPLRLVLAALSLLASSWALAQNHNTPSPYDKQLQTIRQALLEATLETTPTQVISSSWIAGPCTRRLRRRDGVPGRPVELLLT